MMSAFNRFTGAADFFTLIYNFYNLRFTEIYGDGGFLSWYIIGTRLILWRIFPGKEHTNCFNSIKDRIIL